jgi:hypothetical protein
VTYFQIMFPIFSPDFGKAQKPAVRSRYESTGEHTAGTEDISCHIGSRTVRCLQMLLLLIIVRWKSPINQITNTSRVLSPFSGFFKRLMRFKPVKNPEAGGSTFSETSVRASAIRYQVQEDIFNS